MARKKPSGAGSPASPSVPVHQQPDELPVGTASGAVVSLPGALTIHGVREFKSSLLQHLEAADLVLDIEEVREIDTAGVQLLLALRRARVAAGAGLRWQGNPGVVAVAAGALGLAGELALAGDA